MSALTDQRVAVLEARIAELERRPRPRLPRRLLLAALALALIIPAAAIAAPTFTDVPTSNKFYNDIEAIAAAGITSGCTATKYCPDGLVTRGQMAAFLNRLGALGAGKTPKVNAAKLGGFAASAYSRAAYATMRPDECFNGPGSNECTIYNVKGVASIRRESAGTYCVKPASGYSFAGKTPVLTTDDYNSGPATGFGVPIVAYSSLIGTCGTSEIKVTTYRATGATPTVSLSNSTSFGIVIP